MKTDYFAHDAVYKEKQGKGQAGWDTAEISAAVWKQFARLMQHTAIPRSGQLLELGCGAGNLSVGFAALGYQVTGIDISPVAVEWARQRALQKSLAIEFIVDDVLTLPQIEDASFSIAVDSHCFHCIIGPDRATFLANARRLLLPDGVLVLNCMVQKPQTTELPGFDPNTGLLWRGDLAIRTISTQQDIERELQEAGFECLESRVEVEDEVADSLLIIAQVKA